MISFNTIENSQSQREGRNIVAAVMILCLLTGSMNSPAQAQTNSSPAATNDLGQHVQQAVERISPAIVRIRIVGTPGPSNAGAVTSTTTTGLIISGDGEVLTSAFGLNNTSSAIFVEDETGTRTSANVIAKDYLRKLVLLKCNPESLKLHEFSISSEPAVGAYAIATGRFYPSPQPSVSVGIVSALNRIHGLAMQTDAKVSPVNYGGPLVDIEGKVLGLLVPLSPQDSDTEIDAGVEWYDSGIGFAIPIQDALQAAQLLRDGKDRKRGRLGIGLSSRNPLDPNITVSEVHAGSPADLAGIRRGDRIVIANGRRLNRLGEFESTVKQLYAGDGLSIKVMRDNQPIEKSVTLVDRLPRVERGYLGVLPFARDNHNKEDHLNKEDDTSNGVEAAVVPDSPLARANLDKTIVIRSIGDEQINNSRSLNKVLSSQTVGKSLSLTYSLPTEQDKTTTVSITLEKRPDHVPKLTEEQIQHMLNSTGSDETSTWKRSTLSGEESGKSWVFAPSRPIEGQSYGAVVLTESMEKSPEQLIREWSSTCQSHQLVLVVVRNDEETSLSREDLNLVLSAVTDTQQKFSIQPSRIAIVTDDDRSGLVLRALSHPRLPVFHSAAFLSNWPYINSSMNNLLQRKSAALLIMEAANTQETKALETTAISSLRENGISVTTQQSSATVNTATLVANWLLLRRSL